MYRHIEDASYYRTRPERAVLKMHTAHLDEEWTKLIHAAKEAIKTANGNIGQIYHAYEELYEGYSHQQKWEEMKRYALRAYNFFQRETHQSLSGTSRALTHLSKALLKLEQWQELEDVSYKREAFGRESDNIPDRLYAYQSLLLALEKQGKWKELAEESRAQITFGEEVGHLNLCISGHSRLVMALTHQHPRNEQAIILAQGNFRAFIKSHPDAIKIHPELQAYISPIAQQSSSMESRVTAQTVSAASR